MKALDTNIVVRFLIRDDEQQSILVHQLFKQAEQQSVTVPGSWAARPY
jgi:predicted nucleic-acid-binding protein